MHISNFQNSKYMKAADLHGEDLSVKIRQLVRELVGREREEKPVLYFVGREKGMVCNLTNLNTIARILGSEDTDDWTNQSITLTTEMVTFDGRTMPAIRVRSPASPLQARLAAKAETRPGSSPGGGRNLLDDDTIPFGPCWQ